MRKIQKGVEPPQLSAWKAMENDNWQPSYAALSGDVKRAVKSALIVEQGGICCYCERRLLEDDSHIEHCKPQCLAEVDALDFSNLICSCQQTLKKEEPRHCGNLKDDWFDACLFVSPLMADCQPRFLFMANGHIQAANEDDNAAKMTIRKLGLDIPKLNDLRRKILEPFLDEDLSIDDLSSFVNSYLQPSADGVLQEFVSTVADVFEEWVVA